MYSAESHAHMLKFIETMWPVRGQLEKFRTLACVCRLCPLVVLAQPRESRDAWCRYMVQRRERVKSAHSIADFQTLNQRQAKVGLWGWWAWFEGV